MLAARFLRNKDKVRLGNSAYEQFKTVESELVKLSECSSVPWGMITDDHYDKVIRFTLIEGVAYGLMIAECVHLGSKIIERAKKRENPKEES